MSSPKYAIPDKAGSVVLSPFSKYWIFVKAGPVVSVDALFKNTLTYNPYNIYMPSQKV